MISLRKLVNVKAHPVKSAAMLTGGAAVIAGGKWAANQLRK